MAKVVAVSRAVMTIIPAAIMVLTMAKATMATKAAEAKAQTFGASSKVDTVAKARALEHARRAETAIFTTTTTIGKMTSGV